MRSTLGGLLAHLTGALGVPVYKSAPRDRDPAYVLVNPVGGRNTLDAQHSDYALQAWATTYDAAEALSRACCDAMREYGATPYANPVPLGYDGRHYWWQVTFTVHALW